MDIPRFRGRIRACFRYSGAVVVLAMALFVFRAGGWIHGWRAAPALVLGMAMADPQGRGLRRRPRVPADALATGPGRTLDDLLASADIMLWQGRVRWDGAEIRWPEFNVPRSGLYLRLFGRLPVKERGRLKLWRQLNVPEQAEMNRRNREALLSGASEYEQEFCVIKRRGTIWLHEHVSIAPLGPDEWRLVGVLTDVTARREAEAARGKVEEQLQQTVERVDCVLWNARVTERDGRLAWAFELPRSRLQRQLFGCKALSGEAQLYDALRVPELPEMRARSGAAIRSGAPGYEQEFRVIQPERTYWLHEQVSITAEGPRRWLLSGVILDVSVLKAAEAARAQSEAQLQQLFAVADCLLWQAEVVREGDGVRWCRFTTLDSAFSQRLFGGSPPSTGTGLWYARDTPTLAEMDRRSSQAVLSGAPGYEQEFAVLRRGRTFWLHERVSITPAGPGRWNLVGVLMDATARHEAEAARQASEAQLQQILKRADCIVWQGRVRRVGDEFQWGSFRVPDSPLRQLVFGPEQPVSLNELWTLVNVPEMDELNQHSAVAFRSGAPGYEHEFRVLQANRTLWLLERVSITRIGPDEWDVVGILIDVTARREAEEAHRQSEARLRQILERANCMLWQARVVRVNGEFRWTQYRMPPSPLHKLVFGTEQHPTADRLWSLVKIPERPEMDRRSTAALLAGAPGYEQEFRVVQPDRTIWLLERVTLDRVGPDEWEVAGVLIDVTERREAEEERRKVEAQLEQILNRADCLVWQGNVVENAAGGLDWKLYIPRSRLYRTLFGTDPDDRPNLMWSELNVPELAVINARAAAALHNDAPGYEQEFRAQSGGRWYWLREQASITKVGPREWSLVGVITDISARRGAEDALAAQKERLAVTLRAMTEGVITTDVRGMVQFINRAATDMLGCEAAAVVGRPLSEICRLRDRQTFAHVAPPCAQVIESDTTIDLPANAGFSGPDGTDRRIEGRCAPVHGSNSALLGTVLVFHDVTERERLEEKLARASKLESVGVLAGGIAHDFNNILTAILGNITVATLDLRDSSKVESCLRESERAALRARDLTQQLLTFAKGGDPIRTAVRLPEAIAEVAQFVLHGSRIRCQFEFQDDLWPAEADKGQIGQVVQNLVINSVQAMPEGGVIRIGARNETAADVFRQPLEPGNYVHIWVADSGLGIKSEHLSRVFDPYFTTKQQGSGLGLATVYSIVRRHQGHIDVESTLGRGTTFHIWLPASREQQLELPPEPAAVSAPMHGRVLLMDDDAPIREMAALLLNQLGFEVEVAGDGTEAVKEYREAWKTGRPYALIIMDLTVPGGMGGREALEELKQINPDVRAVVSSGYSSDPVLARYREYGFRGVVAKPYRLDELTRALREALA